MMCVSRLFSVYSEDVWTDRQYVYTNDCKVGIYAAKRRSCMFSCSGTVGNLKENCYFNITICKNDLN